ncbi:MAG: DUF3078 domain-containing protein [Flavobacteriales bacterium]|nr:DUF3078 domain-containing protein [Flavobacteriales bacterium]
MKKLLFILSCIAVSSTSFTQITDAEELIRSERTDSLDGWRKGMHLALNGSNVGFTNWAAGGVNAIALNGAVRLYANLKKGKSTWDNNLNLGYGLVKQGDADWIKADDNIDFTSKYGQRATDHWYYAALLNFRTQMTAGYNYPNDSVEISNFFAPAYTLGALGMDYKVDKRFSMFIAPITTKLTFVNDQTLADAGSFGVTEAVYDPATGLKLENGKRFRAELGGYFRSQLNLQLAENIKYTTSLDLFSNYLNKPQNIDVNWQNFLEIKLWKFITLSFATHLIYDDDIDITIYDDQGNETGKGPRLQFKHLTGVGLAWNIDHSPADKKPQPQD